MKWKYFEPVFEYEIILSDIGSPWFGHKRFGYDLVSNIKPSRIVELGTHYGTSFWSFSQAVKDNALDTELIAIDTWKGERHSGYYGEEVYKKILEIKKQFYQRLNIKLIRKTFSESLVEIQDNSVDILHIDGLHTYEAVKKDFDEWIIKMKSDGIILIHDIEVMKDDFGVNCLWEQLKLKYLTLNFFHSYGLGVVFLENDFYQGLKLDERRLQMHYSYLHESTRSNFIQSLIMERDFFKKKSFLLLFISMKNIAYLHAKKMILIIRNLISLIRNKL